MEIERVHVYNYESMKLHESRLRTRIAVVLISLLLSPLCAALIVIALRE